MVLYAGLLAASEVPQTDQYETPGPVKAEDFLPRSAFSGKKVFVEKTAENNGLQNTYRIRAGAREYEVAGSAAALQFLQELKAIDELRRINTAKAFARGLKQSAKGTYQTGKEIVRDPVSAAKKVPQGASSFSGRSKDSLPAKRTILPRSLRPERPSKDCLGSTTRSGNSWRVLV